MHHQNRLLKMAILSLVAVFLMPAGALAKNEGGSIGLFRLGKVPGPVAKRLTSTWNANAESKLVRLNKKTAKNLRQAGAKCKTPETLNDCVSEAATILETDYVLSVMTVGKGKEKSLIAALYDAKAGKEIFRETKEAGRMIKGALVVEVTKTLIAALSTAGSADDSALAALPVEAPAAEAPADAPAESAKDEVEGDLAALPVEPAKDEAAGDLAALPVEAPVAAPAEAAKEEPAKDEAEDALAALAVEAPVDEPAKDEAEDALAALPIEASDDEPAKDTAEGDLAALPLDVPGEVPADDLAALPLDAPPAEEAESVDESTGVEEIKAMAQEEGTPDDESMVAVDEEVSTDAESKKGLRFIAGAHLDLIVPIGKTGSPSFKTSDLSAEGAKSVTGAILLSGKVFGLPDPVQDLGLLLELGWYHYGSEASRENPADPDFTSFKYSSSMHILPIHIGPVYRLPVEMVLPLPLGIETYVHGGFAYQYVWSTTTYTEDGLTVEDATQSDSGFGYFLGAEGSLPLGPGLINAGLRYTSARTDLDFKDTYNNVYNEELGETGGTSILVGYSMLF
ncbi:hypothetical protein KAI87_02505 [Myxococcota bacterium]|nr:hypothetical protein [Myxococcota bacterium]